MNYIEILAKEIRLERDSRRTEADPRNMKARDRLKKDKLYRIYAVLALAKGLSLSIEDVHNAFVAWLADWCNTAPCCVPFAELPEAAQEKDALYLDVILTVLKGKTHASDKTPHL